jgi:exosortase/archaeosortase family protein
MMKPISAEDIGAVLKREKGGGKAIGIAFLILVAIIAIFNSIARTGFVISDSNPASYAIVAMLMIPVLIAFSAKEDLRMRKGWKPIAIGAFLTLAFFLILSYARGSLSFAFYTLGVDALLFPLILAALIVTLFGLDGIKKMKFLLIYSAFASPLLFYWLIRFNAQFVSLNASAVYSLLVSLGLPLTKSGIVLTAPSASSISIASTCADLGVFIALFMFLLPVAYLYEGKTSKKILWLGSALLLLFAANIVRMISISAIWAYSGVSTAASVYHAFAGQILFYIVIIAMFLLLGKYDLSIKNNSLKGLRSMFGRRQMAYVSYWNVAAAFVFAIAVFFATVPYISATSYSITLFSPSSQLSANQTIVYVASSMASSRMNIRGLESYQNTALFSLQSPKSNNSTIYVIAANQGKPIPLGLLTNTGEVSSSESTLTSEGITINSGTVLSQSVNFTVTYFSLPLNINGTLTSVGYEFFEPYGQGIPICYPKETGINGVENRVYNLFVSGTPKAAGIICAAYNVSSGA